MQSRRKSIDPAFQNNVTTLTIDMGFNPIKANHALMKTNNDVRRAIDELTLESFHTRYERIAHNHRFTTMIQLLNLTARKTFILKDNGGAGDCLFLTIRETLARAIPSFARNKTAHDIRVDIVNYIMTHLGQYHNQMTLQTFEDAIQHGVVVNGGKTLRMNNYADEMKKKSTYGTELEISAASQLYKINIYVVSTNGMSFDQLYIGNGYPTFQNTWYIFNDGIMHYTSLVDAE